MNYFDMVNLNTFFFNLKECVFLCHGKSIKIEIKCLNK